MDTKVARMPAIVRVSKRSKYGVRQDAAGKLARTYRGVLYDSAAEARYAAQLDTDPTVIGWTRQNRYYLMVNGKSVGALVMDFEVKYTDGTYASVDVKGVETTVWKLKRKLFEAIYGRKITVIPAKDVR